MFVRAEGRVFDPFPPSPTPPVVAAMEDDDDDPSAVRREALGGLALRLMTGGISLTTSASEREQN